MSIHTRWRLLSFATEFPVDSSKTEDDFLGAVKRWILDSPHARLTPQDLETYTADEPFSAKRGGQAIDIVSAKTADERMVAIRVAQVEQDLEWSTEAVYSKNQNDAWVGIRTSRESGSPTVRLPAAKKPLLVKLLLSDLGGAIDGKVRVLDRAHNLSNNDIALAARLMMGRAGCRLPVVYVSHAFRGDYTIDPEWLAKGLCGMAHVITEPNRAFSRRLQIDVASQNVYGGAVGIYWPEAAGRRSFFFEGGPEEMSQAIVEEVRTALLNRRPLHRLTWSAVQEVASRRRFEELRASGSVELESYVQMFDAEMAAKDARLNDAEHEIARLTRELRGYEARESVATGLTLNVGEQNLLPSEVSEVILDALEDAAARLQSDSRRSHIVASVLATNLRTGVLKANRERLKATLRGYTSMTKDTRQVLDELGFEISEEGKHYKLIYRDDERYTFILAKTGSDRRGGLNSASDISKRIY